MPRSWSADHLQAYPFWLVDVAPLGAMSLPIFNPFMGFSAITAPEINMTVETITEANWIFDKKVITGASVGPMTLSRGTTWYDSDFWHWVMATLKGDPSEFTAGAIPLLRTGGVTPRRTMMLIHFFNRMVANPFDVNADLKATAYVSGLVGVGAAVGGGAFAGVSAAGATGLAGLSMKGLGFPAVEFAARIPAKIYILYGCVPSRYKLDGDFDASSGDVSIQELEMQVEMVEHKSFEF